MNGQRTKSDTDTQKNDVSTVALHQAVVVIGRAGLLAS